MQLRTMDKQTLIIVGGGISGLVAARQLSQHYEIILLEAMPGFGGRIRTVTAKEFPVVIEGGAEFVHGEAEQTIKLLNEAGIPFVKVEGEFYHKEGNILKIQDDQDDGWGGLMDKMGDLARDMTLQQFLDIHFSGVASEGLRKRAVSFAQGFDLADEHRVSVKALYSEWSDQSEDSRVEGGYDRLIRFLVDGCREKGVKLVNQAVVKEVRWQEGSVQVFTADQQHYHAAKCLLTVSLGVLKSNYIGFRPAVDNYITAAGQIGFGTVIKVILAFNQKFWKDDAGFFLSGETIPTWWTQLPEDTAVLSGWAGGPKGAELSSYTDEQLLEKALESLAAIFNLDIKVIKERLTGWKIFNWKNDPAVQGAYSYQMPESRGALELLNTPVDRTLYFAGEGLYSGSHPGTVEAAIVNVLQVAEKLASDSF